VPRSKAAHRPRVVAPPPPPPAAAPPPPPGQDGTAAHRVGPARARSRDWQGFGGAVAALAAALLAGSAPARAVPARPTEVCGRHWRARPCSRAQPFAWQRAVPPARCVASCSLRRARCVASLGRRVAPRRFLGRAVCRARSGHVVGRAAELGAARERRRPPQWGGFAPDDALLVHVQEERDVVKAGEVFASGWGVFAAQEEPLLGTRGPQTQLLQEGMWRVSRLALWRPWLLLLLLHVLYRWFVVSESLLDLNCLSSWADAYTSCVMWL